MQATKGRQSRVFYTMPEYETWKEEAGNLRGWSIKYYKGLGTSTSKEAKEYFSELDSHRKTFVWEGARCCVVQTPLHVPVCHAARPAPPCPCPLPPAAQRSHRALSSCVARTAADRASCSRRAGDEDGKSLELAFSKKKADDRKQWLRDFVPGTFLDHGAEEITYSEFVHRELILFSRADVERSIPSMLDGLKPGQRKVLFACFKRNLKSDVKARFQRVTAVLLLSQPRRD